MATKAYLNTKQVNLSGGFNAYQTIEVPVKISAQLPKKGRTVAGYGSQLPTRYMIKVSNRWLRVKAVCYSNATTLYVGKKYNQCLTVTIQEG